MSLQYSRLKNVKYRLIFYNICYSIYYTYVLSIYTNFFKLLFKKEEKIRQQLNAFKSFLSINFNTNV